MVLDTKNNTTDNLHHQSKPDHGATSPLTPKTMAMAVPGMFLLCCSFLCPCCHSRRKQHAHTVLSKDPSSMESMSPLEVSSSSEKIPPSPLRVPPSPSRFSMSPKVTTIGSVHLNMNQVVKATRNFSPSLRVGEGGFGTVYKAQMPDGQVVAIKRAKKADYDSLRAEFSSEVEMLAKIEHRNLVRLLGYVDNHIERVIITEFVPNGTLRHHLDGQHGNILDFNQRLEISIDIAHALTYLHLYADSTWIMPNWAYGFLDFIKGSLEHDFVSLDSITLSRGKLNRENREICRPLNRLECIVLLEKQIIHRDVKSSNILLTESFRAKVADFGFARLGPGEANQTHILTKVKGTAGYLDPEYLRTYELTHKSDVYSYGILLLEILTARRPVEMKREVDQRISVRWAFKKYTEGKAVEILDPLMNETVDGEIVGKMFGLAFQCAAPTRADRPSMKQVGEKLWGIRMDYMRSVKR